MNRNLDLIRLTRPLNALSPLILVAIGALTVSNQLNLSAFIAALIGTFCLHGAATLYNDLEDIDVDRLNRVNTGLVNGQLSKRAVWWSIIVLICLIGIACLWLPLITFGLFVVTAIFSWLYSGHPYVASRRPLASIMGLGVIYGTMPILLGASLVGIDAITISLAFAFGLSRASLSLLKDYKDATGDATVGKRTFLLTYGNTQVTYTSLALLLVGYGTVLYVLWSMVQFKSLTILLLALALLIWLRLQLFGNKSYAQLQRLFQQNGAVQLGVDVVIVWLVIS